MLRVRYYSRAIRSTLADTKTLVLVHKEQYSPTPVRLVRLTSILPLTPLWTRALPEFIVS